MKFITEDDLRNLYRKEPFTTYEIEASTRLTPGAHQFLADRKININGNNSYMNKDTIDVKQTSVQQKKNSDWKKKKIKSKMKSAEALFLLVGEELLGGDVSLAEDVINLGKQFSNIKDFVDGKGIIENFSCKECKGINVDNFSDSLDDCFEITELHIHLKTGRKIIILHRLRCILCEIEPTVLELCEGSDDELYKEAIGMVNKIINTLSQMICSICGGETCQRKI